MELEVRCVLFLPLYVATDRYLEHASTAEERRAPAA